MALLVCAGMTAAEAGTPVADGLLTASRGDMPLLVAVPHGGEGGIPGAVPRTGGNKEIDRNTVLIAGAMADEIARLTGRRPYLVMSRVDRKYVDLNRPPRLAYEKTAGRDHYEGYHRAVREYLEDIRLRWKRGLLVDLHGQYEDPGALHRGTRDGKTVASLLKRFGAEALCGPESVFVIMESLGYRVHPLCGDGGIGREERIFNGGYTVMTYGGGAGVIDALQVEVGNDYRRDGETAVKTGKDLAAAVTRFMARYLPAP